MTTDGDGRVTRLELGANGLSGTLPAALGRLARLEALLLDGNVYLAGPLPAGLRELPALATVDLTDTELCAPEDAAFQDWTATISFSGLICPPAEQSVIDVAVFYTPAARNHAGGTAAIETRIDLMAAETNQAYRASGVNQRVALAAVEEVEYTAAGAIRVDVERLQDPSDGHMDEVHTTRDQVAADIVVLIGIGRAGRAYDILTPANASAANAFATSGIDSRTFAHELGHVMGLAHDRYVACFDPSGLGRDGCSEAATAYAYGYVNQQAFEEDAPVSARWHTIMAFGGQCSNEGRFGCRELLRFSNPDQIHPDPGRDPGGNPWGAWGDPLGVPGREPSTAVDGPADAVRTLNRTRATVANFRTPPAVTVSFGVAAYIAAESGAAATVTVNLSPAPERPVSVPLVSVGATGATASDYTAPGSVAFAAAETAQTFTVTAVDDDADDDGETVTLAFDTRVLPSGMTVGSPATATVTLTDDDLVTAAPSVRAVALTSDPGPDAIYALGDEIAATVRFDKSVTVTGAPQLGLTVGSGTPRQMTHRGGGGEVLTFAYTVAEDDSDTDGVSIAADSLSGTIRDSANENAMLTHVAVEDDAGHRVDGVRPLLQGAVADGNRLTLTYAEALHEGSPTETRFHAADAFTVTSSGNAVRVDKVAVMQQTVLLDLSGWVLRGDAVTVSYRPGAWTIRDRAGTAAAAFSDRSATNETPQLHYDTDHDGLIEITTLAQLDAVRHDLDGDGAPSGGIDGPAVYRAAFPLAFPDEQARRLDCHRACIGYELRADLDFLDVNGDGRVDTDDDTNGDGRVAADDTPWWNGGAGWDPISTGGQTSYSAEFFEGNGHAIRHLFINRPSRLGVGLFGNSSSNIRNVGVIEIDVTGNTVVGGLVGTNTGRIEASYASGPVSGTTYVGGLVGSSRGRITTSYASGPVSGTTYVGGLVGLGRGRITTSYATGPVSGIWRVGGLVGLSGGPITTSYATGPVSGDAVVGGLVGYGNGRIEASYATGAVSGRWVAGLVGLSGGSSEIHASYWDTTTSRQATGSDGQGQTTTQLQTPADATGIYADWDTDLWHFGEADEYPALVADFDGDGDATWQEFGYQLRERPTLTANPGQGQVGLSWTAVTASHWTPAPSVTYTLTRNDGATSETLGEGLSGLTFTDIDVTAGVTYTYRVAAVVDGVEAVRSAAVAVTGAPPNRPPVPQGTLAARTLPIDAGAFSVSVAGVFSDPDNDVLTYGAVSSAPQVASVSVSGSTLTVTPLTRGMATITVTATDVDGSSTSASQTFVVTVPNRPPEVGTTLQDHSDVEVRNGVFTVDVSGAFRDPDGDALTYGVTSSAPSVASVGLDSTGSGVSVAPLSGGTAEVTVTATDGFEPITPAMQTFTVTVANRPPVARGRLEALSLQMGRVRSVEVSGAFDDPDNDALTYAASSSAPGVATVEMAATGGAAGGRGPSGSTVTVTPLAAGETRVTVTATDAGGSGGTATQSFRVTVPEEEIVVDYDADDDGLIEIVTLAQLDAVRRDLDGDGVPAGSGAAAAGAAAAAGSGAGAGSGASVATGAEIPGGSAAPGAAAHAAAFPDAAEGMGCPAGGCLGYELAADLDFDTDGSGAADAGDAFWNGGAGWLPLGTLDEPFTAVFAGNGRTVSHLFVGGGDNAGLFGVSSGVIRGVGVVDADVTGSRCAGALAGLNGGRVEASWSTGAVTADSCVGGLVGVNGLWVPDGGTFRPLEGFVTASWSAAEATAEQWVGGLVGYDNGTVVASYATGAVTATTEGSGAGGLVGRMGFGGNRITASYATGAVSGPGGAVGGLVGHAMPHDRVEASYWDTETSGVTRGGGGAGRTTAALQEPTGYTGSYAAWDVDVDGDGVSDAPWDFGTSSAYPALSVDVDGDGAAT